MGTVLGAILAHHLPSFWLRIILGVVLLLIGIKMLLPEFNFKKRQTPPRWLDAIVSTIIGGKSGLLGIGGGALMIPYLTYSGVERRRTAVISSLCTLTVSIIGTIAFTITGFNEPDLPYYAFGFVYWPAVVNIAIPSMLFAPMGAYLTYRLPVSELKIAFVVMLFIAAANLLYT